MLRHHGVVRNSEAQFVAGIAERLQEFSLKRSESERRARRQTFAVTSCRRLQA